MDYKLKDKKCSKCMNQCRLGEIQHKLIQQDKKKQVHRFLHLWERGFDKQTLNAQQIEDWRNDIVIAKKIYS